MRINGYLMPAVFIGLKKALRLHQDLEIDWVAVAMVIDLMQEKEALQKENEAYQRQLKRFIKDEIHLAKAPIHPQVAPGSSCATIIP